jgi:hypothetical protein
VFVEAIIVISFFTLCFLGVMYFRELYLGKMRVQRLARASAMGHAMNACKSDPKAGIDTDLPKTPFAPPKQTPGTPFDIDKEGPNKGSDALAKMGRSQGGTPLDVITEITISTTASATTASDPNAKKQGFVSQSVASASFVTCGDEVSDEQYGQIVDEIANLF